MARKGKHVEDEPQEPVAAGRWLPVEEELLATCYRAGFEDHLMSEGLLKSMSVWVAFSQEDAWAVLRFHPKWDAPEQVDLTGDVPGASQEDLFGHDARPRFRRANIGPAKKSNPTATANTGGSSGRRAQFGELMEQELRLKWEAAERVFEAQAG
ncbi:hypothetical protein Tco_0693914 [Tanacetum coccineum]